MHIIQYLLNLPFNNIIYNGAGKVRLIGKADTKFTISQFKSILKFKPDDIGYDINGIEWRIISVFNNNNVYSYEAYNGINVVVFDNFDLYNAAEINAIRQNNLDSEIEIIVNKIKQLDKYIPTPEPDPYYSTLRFNVDDLAYDKYGIEWRIISIVKVDNKYEIEAVTSNKNKVFCINELYSAAEINQKYQSVLNVEIEKIIFKINHLNSIIPDDDIGQTYSKIIKFRAGDKGFDKFGIQWEIVAVFYENNEIKIYAHNNLEEKIFCENDLFTASEADKNFQNQLDEKIESVLERINLFNNLLYKEKIIQHKNSQANNTPVVKKVQNKKTKISKIEVKTTVNNKISKGDICLDKKNYEWTIIEIFEFNNKPKYQASRNGSTKIFNEKDLKKKTD